MNRLTPFNILVVFAIVIMTFIPVASTKSTASVVTAPAEQAALSPNVNITTQHYDNARTGANLQETILNTSNVNTTKFGLLFSRQVQGHVYAQPLYVANLNMPGVGVRNVVFIATMHNDIYAFDADNPLQSDPLWHVNMGPSAPLNPPDPIIGHDCGGGYFDILVEVGVVSTPVIDLSTNRMYLVSLTKDGSGVYAHTLHALSLFDGSDVTTPTVVQGSLNTANGPLAFSSASNLQRSSLLLNNGNIYFSFAGYCDSFPYNGWVFKYSASNLQRQAIFASMNTSQFAGAGVWQAGQGLTADSSGNIYFLTGNGEFDGMDWFGDSALKLNSNLVRQDYFTPHNQEALAVSDSDLGSSGILLIPGTNLLIGGGKEGRLYLMDRSHMGGYQQGPGGGDGVVQTWQAVGGPNPDTATHHIHGSPIYWNGPAGMMVYVWGESDFMRAYKFNPVAGSNPITGTFTTTPFKLGPTRNDDNVMPGGILSISANGSTANTGLVWASHPTLLNSNKATVTGTLQVLNATDISQELWNSDMRGGADSIGWFAKFEAPTIANGKVYIGTFADPNVDGSPSFLRIYGLNGSVSVNAGSGQSTPVNTAFSNSLKVQVRDGNNNPLQNANVTFIAPSSGASGSFTGGSNVVNVLTDASGIATAPTFTANGTTGSYSISAMVNSSQTPANFSMNNTSGSCANALQVTSGGDSGSCSLRSAIIQANSQVGSGNVVINLNTNLISLDSPLPVINNNSANTITINGACTPDGNGRGLPAVQLKPSGSYSGGTNPGLSFTNNIVITGVIVTNFGGYGIELNGNNNQVKCSWIGTANGSSAAANAGGVKISGNNNSLGLQNVVTSGNLISGNNGIGVQVASGTGNKAYYNRIGLQQSGNNAVLDNTGGALRVLNNAGPGGQLILGRYNQIHS